MKPSGGFLTLFCQQSGTYAGLVKCSEVVKLLEHSTITVTAMLTRLRDPQPSHQGNGKDKNKTKTKATSKAKASKFAYQPHQTRIRLVVHGPRVSQQVVGDALGNAGHYLQHPFASEVAHTIEYANPHYLAMPGEELPALEAVPAEDSGHDDGAQDYAFDGTTQAHLLRIFDDAGGYESDGHPEPSPRLSVALKKYVLITARSTTDRSRHQLTALSWLMEVESGKLLRVKFPSFWVPGTRASSQR